MITEWNGEQVKRNMIIAAKWGIDATMAAAVRKAKGRVAKKTTTLQGSIQMRQAQQRGDRVVGLWGSFNVNYALYVEEGTDPHVILPSAKKALWWPGLDHPVKSVNHPGTKAQPYLIPSADEEYPKLAGRIKRKFAQLAGRT